MKLKDLDDSLDPAYWNELDQETLAHALTRGGRLLDLEKSDEVFGPASDLALSSLAYRTGSEWGEEKIMNGSLRPLSPSCASAVSRREPRWTRS